MSERDLSGIWFTGERERTKVMDYWNHVLWSDETKINLSGSDGVKRV